MKKISIACVFLLAFSTVLFAGEKKPMVCYSHGQCQEQMGVTYARLCMVVKTGFDNYGDVTCAVKCQTWVHKGSYCKFVEGQRFGFCREEVFSMPDFDPEHPDCSNAIDDPDFDRPVNY